MADTETQGTDRKAQSMTRAQICTVMSGVWLMPQVQIEKLAARLAIGAKAQGRRDSSNADGIAVIPVYGVVEQRESIWSMIFGGASTEGISRSLEMAMSDPNVKGIVLDVDSPGGTVPGVQDLADRIYEASHDKPIVAVANSLAASAAYWISSAAGRVVAAPGSDVGSIGVYSVHMDWSEALAQDGIKVTVTKAGKYKAEGNPYEPLSEEAADYEQKQVNAIYNDFIASVARGRGVSAATVRSDFGQGRTMLAGDAKSAGLVDEVDTLASVVSRLARGGMRGVKRVRQMDSGTLQRQAILARRNNSVDT